MTSTLDLPRDRRYATIHRGAQASTAPAEPLRISPARGPPAWDHPPVAAVPDWDALAQAQPEYVFDQQVQW